MTHFEGDVSGAGNGFDRAPLPPIAADIGGIVSARPRRARVPPPRRFPPETVEAARKLIEGTELSIVAIAAEVGVSESTIGNWIRARDWKRPAAAPKLRGTRGPFDFSGRRARLMARLYRAFGRQLASLEARGRGDDTETTEKDARTLAVLAKTLETLTDLDRDGDGTQTKKPEPPHRADHRLELARRIAAWAESGEEPARPDHGGD